MFSATRHSRHGRLATVKAGLGAEMLSNVATALRRRRRSQATVEGQY